jgi:hypothetical protein
MKIKRDEKSLQKQIGPSTSLYSPEPQVEVQVNSRLSFARVSLVCRLAAHGAGDRNDVLEHLNRP